MGSHQIPFVLASMVGASWKTKSVMRLGIYSQGGFISSVFIEMAFMGSSRYTCHMKEEEADTSQAEEEGSPYGMVA